MPTDTQDEGHVPIAPTQRQLLWIVGAAVIAATIVFVIAVLPAEWRLDPTGIGRILGLDRLAGPAEVDVAAVAGPAGAPVTFSDVPFRTDTVDIPLKAGGTLFKDELEWKVRMKEGATIVFSWTVPEVKEADAFYYSFHGQSELVPGAETQEIKVTTFKEDVGTKLSGTLIAPYDGLWGWYLQNQWATPVVVRLQIAGYYEIATPDDIAKAASTVLHGPPPS